MASQDSFSANLAATSNSLVDVAKSTQQALLQLIEGTKNETKNELAQVNKQLSETNNELSNTTSQLQQITANITQTQDTLSSVGDDIDDFQAEFSSKSAQRSGLQATIAAATDLLNSYITSWSKYYNAINITKLHASDTNIKSMYSQYKNIISQIDKWDTEYIIITKYTTYLQNVLQGLNQAKTLLSNFINKAQQMEA